MKYTTATTTRPYSPSPTHRKGRVADTTREAVLSSARRLFALRGYDGASIRAITRDARANLGAVTYHYGSKQALYAAVLDRVLSPLRRRVTLAGESEGLVLDRIDRVIRAFFEHLEENPDMPQLMLQEIAAGKLPPLPVRDVLSHVSTALAGLVTAGQRSGEIRSGDPLLLGLSCVYQPVHLTLISRMARAVLGVDMADPEVHARIVEHSVHFARRGLEAGGRV